MSLASTSPTGTGRWAALVSEESYACSNRSAIWAWSDEPEADEHSPGNQDSGDIEQTAIAIVDSAGDRQKPWFVPGKVTAIDITHDCRVAWISTTDKKQIFSIDRDRDVKPVAFEGSKADATVRSIVAAQDGIHAWIRYDDETPVAWAERNTSGIRLIRPVGIQRTANEVETQGSYRGERLWIIPPGPGLWIADSASTHSYDELRNVDFLDIFPSDEGRLGWLTTRDKGLYLVDYLGHAITVDGRLNLLPDQDVKSVWAGPNLFNATITGEYAWVTTASHNLYCFRAHVDGSGHTTVESMNNGRSISNRPGGEPLYVQTLRWGPQTVWVATTPSRSRNDWQRFWRLMVRSNGEIEAKPIDPALYKNKKPRTFFFDPLKPELTWVRTSDLSLYEIDLDKGVSSENPFKALPVTNIMITDRPSRLWVVTSGGIYLVGPAAELASSLTVRLGNQPLIAPGRSAVLRGQLSASEAAVSIKIPAARRLPSAVITLSFAPMGRDNGAPSTIQSVALGESTVAPNGAATVPLFVRSPFRAGTQYMLELSYTDNLLSDAHLRWLSIPFRPAWYLHPYVKAFAYLVLPIILFCISLHRYRAIRQWVPIVVPGIELTASRLAPQSLSIAPQDLAVVAVMILAATLLAALWSPSLLRALATVQPYRAAVPAVMQFPLTRRRFFSGYVNDLLERIGRTRYEASGESYVDLPCTVLQRSGDVGASEQDIHVNSLERWIAARDSEERRTILIEAPGGRGKSALLHELLDRAVKAFARDPRSPLPVVADPRAKSPDELMQMGLGRHSLSSEYSALQLSSGQVVIFADSVDDGTALLQSLETLFNTPAAGQHTRVCAAARPVSRVRQTFQKADRWTIVRPERLDSASVRKFVTRYDESDALDKDLIGLAPSSLETILAIARSADGTYLPLLVRFAMLLDEPAESIGDLYQGTLERLVSRSANEGDARLLLASAEALARETYWEGQERAFLFDRPASEATANVAQLFQTGILIEADTTADTRSRQWPTLVGFAPFGKRPRFRERPYTVRFLHDSMQSYLVAKALFAAGDWSVLFRAAGDPAFATAGSDFLPGMGSELFQMCVHVFQPKAKLYRWITEQLRSWAVLAGPSLAVEQIRSTLPGGLLAVMDKSLDKQLSAGAYINSMTALLETSRDPSDVLYAYAALARSVWPLIGSTISVQAMQGVGVR